MWKGVQNVLNRLGCAHSKAIETYRLICRHRNMIVAPQHTQIYSYLNSFYHFIEPRLSLGFLDDHHAHLKFCNPSVEKFAAVIYFTTICGQKEFDLVQFYKFFDDANKNSELDPALQRFLAAYYKDLKQKRSHAQNLHGFGSQYCSYLYESLMQFKKRYEFDVSSVVFSTAADTMINKSHSEVCVFSSFVLVLPKMHMSDRIGKSFCVSQRQYVLMQLVLTA